MSLRVGVDLDGVIANFNHAVVKIIRAVWPEKELPENYEPQDWDYTGVLNSSEWSRVWKIIKETPFFWLDLPPYLENVEALQIFLHRYNEIEVFFVTSRIATIGDSPLVQSSWWLENFDLWPRDGFSVVLPVASAAHKTQIAEGLGLEFFIDDYTPTVESLQTVKGLKAYLLDRPYNQNIDLPRVKSMYEFLEKVKRGASQS